MTSPILDLTPVDVAPLYPRPVATVLIAFVAVGTVFAALAALGIAVFYTFVMPQSERGRCLIIDANACSSLSLAYIEEVSELSLPSDTEVVDSGSGKFLLAGYTRALLRLPQGATPPLDVNHSTAPSRTAGGREMIVEALRERGVTTITGTRYSSPGGPRYSAAITQGTDDSGTTWVNIGISWNG
jgi:hypothetical protein